MNNVMKSLNQFLRNKNIVTIGGVILIIAILYFGYNSQIQRQVQPVRNVPIAQHEIPAGSMVTEEMIDYVDIPRMLMQEEKIARSSGEVVGKYVDYNTIVPDGSLFYRDVLIEEEILPDSIFDKVKDGHRVHRFPVSMETTFGNAILPGNMIDMYMKVVEPNTRKIIFGKLLENIEVIAVRDSRGIDVFSTRDREMTPSMIIFGLEPELHNLLNKAEYLTQYQVEIFPVPHGGSVEAPEGTMVRSEVLKDFINSYTFRNPELEEHYDDDDFDFDEDDDFDYEDYDEDDDEFEFPE